MVLFDYIIVIVRYQEPVPDIRKYSTYSGISNSGYELVIRQVEKYCNQKLLDI